MNVPAPTRQLPPVPHSSVTLLLAARAPSRGEPLRKLVARVRQLQSSARGVERARVHVKTHGPRVSGKTWGHNAGVPGRCGRWRGIPSIYTCSRFHMDCNLHRFLWTPSDERVYVEIKAWDADWAVYAVRSVIAMLGSSGAQVEQVWAVIRSGTLAWLQSKPQDCIPRVLLKSATLVYPKSPSSASTPISLLGLPCSSALALLELPCDFSSDDSSLAPNWCQGIRSAGASLQSVNDSLLIQSCGRVWGSCCAEFLITLRWKHQRQSVVEFVEQQFGVIVMVRDKGPHHASRVAISEDMIYDDLRICVVGSSQDSVEKAVFFLSGFKRFMPPFPQPSHEIMLRVEWLEQVHMFSSDDTALSLYGSQGLVIQYVDSNKAPSFLRCMLINTHGVRLLKAMKVSVVWCATEDFSDRGVFRQRVLEMAAVPVEDAHISLAFLREHCGDFESTSSDPDDVENELHEMYRAMESGRAAGGNTRGRRAMKSLAYHSCIDAIARHDVAIVCSYTFEVHSYSDLDVHIIGKPESVKQLCIYYQAWQQCQQGAQEMLVKSEEEKRTMENDLVELQERLQKCEAEHDQMRNEFEAERSTMVERCRELQRASTAGGRVEDMLRMQNELESWRQQPVDLRQTFSRPHLIELVQNALRQLVPADHYGDCNRMRRVTVQSVEEVANVQLWKQYTLKRQQIIESLLHRRTCPWADRIAPGTVVLQELFSYIQSKPEANEVILLHGTTMEKATHIIRQGFDERLTHRALYGRGVYFTTDACKTLQYVGPGTDACIIVARVLLGHPFLAEGPMQNCERPPDVEPHGFPHDSIVARPGICNGKGKGRNTQVHWEFVVPRGDSQIYPELLARISF